MNSLHLHLKNVVLLSATILLVTVTTISVAAASSNEIPELVRLAEGGSAEAQTALGFRYISGQGVARSPSEAYRWYSKAAAQNHAGGLFSLGSLYYNGDGVEKSDLRAVELYQRAANLGHAGAMDNLGLFYALGQGVEADLRQSMRYMAHAAANGHRGAIADAATLADTIPVATIQQESGLRQVPATSESPSATLAAGTKIHILHDPGSEWLEIYVPNGHQIGFVQRAIVRVATENE